VSVVSAGTRCVSSSTSVNCDLPKFLLTFLYTQHSFLPVTSKLVNDRLGRCIQAQKNSYPLKEQPPLKPRNYKTLCDMQHWMWWREVIWLHEWNVAILGVIACGQDSVITWWKGLNNLSLLTSVVLTKKYDTDVESVGLQSVWWCRWGVS